MAVSNDSNHDSSNLHWSPWGLVAFFVRTETAHVIFHRGSVARAVTIDQVATNHGQSRSCLSLTDWELNHEDLYLFHPVQQQLKTIGSSLQINLAHKMKV
jgi:hypothetical protein